MIKISSIINPTKVLEFKNGLKIHLEGVDFKAEQFIESIKYRKVSTLEESDALGTEYVSRLIKHCIKKVEGVVIEEDGVEKPFEVQFDSTGLAIDDKSYTIIMRILMNQGDDVTTELHNFYNESRLNGITIEDVKKKEKKE